ncbi:hypothetical protein EE612_005208 [Oryza sativa]|nr:hypothetical protein EE612_005208 [Oryza sativa]
MEMIIFLIDNPLSILPYEEQPFLMDRRIGNG